MRTWFATIGASVTITGYIDVYGTSLVNSGTIYVGYVQRKITRPIGYYGA